MTKTLALCVLVLAVVASGCGSSVLRALRTVQSTTPSGGGKPDTPAVVAFTASGAAWEVGRGGALFIAKPGRPPVRVGMVPSRDSVTGRGYVPAFAVAADPTNPSRIYVNSDALYVTKDGGHTWLATGHNAGGSWSSLVVAVGAQVYALRGPTAQECGTCGPPTPAYWSLFASSDHGVTWHEVARYSPLIISALVAVRDAPPGSLFVATSSGLFLHVPGRRDVERDEGIPRPYGNLPSIANLAASGRAGSSTLYAATADGENSLVTQIYTSSDLGRHWRLQRSPFDDNSGMLIADPSRPNVAYAVVEVYPANYYPAEAASTTTRVESKIFVTQDDAYAWHEIWRGCLINTSVSGTSVDLMPGQPNSLVVQTCNGAITRIPS